MALIIAIIIIALIIVVSHRHSRPRAALCSLTMTPTLQLCPRPPHHGFVLVLIASPPPLLPLLLSPWRVVAGQWQVIIGVWYKNLKDGEVQSVVHMLFGQVYLPATRWLDGWTDNGVSNCQIFWVLTGLVCVWTGLRCETAGPLAFDLARAVPTSIDVVCIVTRWNYEGAAVNLNSCVDLPGAADTSPSCSNTRVAMHVTYHPSSFVWQWVV